MTIYLIRTKMLFVFAKEGLYYQFLSNTTSEQNDAKLLHEYGLNPANLSHKRWWMCCVRCTYLWQMCTNCSKKMYKTSVSMYDLRETLVD